LIFLPIYSKNWGRVFLRHTVPVFSFSSTNTQTGKQMQLFVVLHFLISVLLKTGIESTMILLK